MAKDITLEKYEKFALYVQVFTLSVMFSIFYENTKFTFGSLVDIHSQFNDVHIFLLGPQPLAPDLQARHWPLQLSRRRQLAL